MLSPPEAGDYQAEPPLPWLRWTLLSALLVGEVLGLTVSFDTGAFAGQGTWWAWLLSHTHSVPQLALGMAAALFVLGGWRLRGELRAVCCRSRDLTWLFLLSHLAVFAFFVCLTTFVLTGGIQHTACPGAWVVSWAALAGFTFLSWLAAVLPPSAWWLLARRCSGPLLAGVLVGVGGWGAGQVTQNFWLPLGRCTFWLVQQLLRPFIPDLVAQPADLVVGSERFAVEIAPHCSGCEGIGLVWVFLGAYLWLQRQDLRFPAAYLLLPLGTAAIWLANAVRIATLVAIGTWGAPEIALGGFHSQAGWLAFLAVSLGMAALAQSMPFFSARPTLPARPGASASGAYLVPLLVLVATFLATQAVSSGFDYFYPVRVLAVGMALWSYRSQYTGLFRFWSGTAVVLGGVVFIIWLALEPAPDPRGTHAFSTALAGAPVGCAALWLFFRAAGSILLVPLAEELAFRGYLPRRLQAADFQDVPPGRFTWFSFLASSAAFGFLHGRWLAGLLAGMLYAAALQRRGELSDAVLAHATTNALIAAYVVGTQTWSLWT